MIRYLYGYEITANRLFLKFICIDETNPMTSKTEIHSLNEFTSGNIPVANLKIVGNTIEVEGKTVRNTQELVSAMNKLKQFSMSLPDGSTISVDKLGRISVKQPSQTQNRPTPNNTAQNQVQLPPPLQGF